jgi:hypothetical protein
VNAAVAAASTGSLMMAVVIVALALLLAHGSAVADIIYKCSSGGKISYGQTPCQDGPSVVLKAAPPPVPDAADQARLARQSGEAARMAADRRKQAEKDQRQAQRDGERRARAAAASAKKCAALKLRSKWASDDARTADTPTAQAKAKVNASRAAEQLALECP